MPEHTHSTLHARADLTGLVLAGGQGSRMGGVDKGLQLLHNQPLALHAAQRLAPQVGALLISANRHHSHYAAWGYPVLADDVAWPDFAGPLAGFATGLAHCTTPWLLTVPCDSPLFPLDLAQRMLACATQHGASLVLAAAPDAQGVLRPQPTFALLQRALLPSLQTFLDQGGRKIGAWAAQHNRLLCAFDQPGDASQAFCNLNTLEELQQLEQLPAWHDATSGVSPTL